MIAYRPVAGHPASHSWSMATTGCSGGGRTTVVAGEIGNNHSGVYKQPYSPRRLSVSAWKSCVCMPNWLNNLEPVTSYQEIEGVAQSDHSFATTVGYY